MYPLDLIDGLVGVTQGHIMSGAFFSSDLRHRYALWRVWDETDLLVWCMLNPSTADGAADDPTIRRCIGWAKRWDRNTEPEQAHCNLRPVDSPRTFGGIFVVNAYALRSTDPAVMLSNADRIGDQNDELLQRIAALPNRLVVAWGDRIELVRHDTIANIVASRYKQAWCLGRTQHGVPRHPVRLAYETPLDRWP